MRALQIEFAKTFKNDNTLQTATENGVPSFAHLPPELNLAEVIDWGVDWGTSEDPSEASPLAFSCEDRYLPRPCDQKDRRLRQSLETCNLSQLLAPSGENAPAAMVVFPKLRPLLEWKVPVPEREDESPDSPKPGDLSDFFHVSAEPEVTEGYDGSESTPSAAEVDDVPFPGPSCGFLHVHGVLLLEPLIVGVCGALQREMCGHYPL